MNGILIPMQIKRYCVLDEEHNGENVFKVHRGYILGNPYTHIKDKTTRAMVVVKTREEAIEKYKKYFELSLDLNEEFKQEFNRMVEACMKYDEVWIGCYCKPNEECHGDFIISRLRQECMKRLLTNLKLNAESF